MLPLRDMDLETARAVLMKRDVVCTPVIAGVDG